MIEVGGKRHYIASSGPFFVPATGSFLEVLEGGFVFVGVELQLLLGFFELVFVLALVLADLGHPFLGKAALETETVLFVAIASLEMEVSVSRGEGRRESKESVPC